MVHDSAYSIANRISGPYEYLDRWLETAVKPRVREKTCQDYESMLRRYVRPSLGERLLSALSPLDLQTTYRQMIERDLSARTVRYTHALFEVRDASGVELATIAGESGRWNQTTSAVRT